MAGTVTVDDGQMQKLLAAIDALEDHGPYWKHFVTAALPIFMASLLGLATALLLDWLKTRRDNNKANKERLEKELALLSGANTAIAFNISALTHTVLQQVLPHHEKSHAARAALESLLGDPSQMAQFNNLLHSEFEPMMKRCPEPYLEDLNLSKDLPFLIAKDPALIMLSGWIITYTRNLKTILNDRNKLIDKATIENPKNDLDVIDLHWQVKAQANISNTEVLNSYQLFLQLEEASRKIENIVGSEYKSVAGPKLKIQRPEILGKLMSELEQIARRLVPD
jgi:hypothetical protein